MSEHVCERPLLTQSHKIDVNEANTYDKSIVSYRMSNTTQERQVINVKIEVEFTGLHNITEMDQGIQMTNQVDQRVPMTAYVDQCILMKTHADKA